MDLMAYFREVSFFTRRGAPKRGPNDFLSLKGDHLHFLKETKYFVKHFRFQRKGLSDATWGRNFQRDILSQCKSVQLHSRFDVDFS